MSVRNLPVTPPARAGANTARSALVILAQLVVAGAIGFALGLAAGSPATGLLVGLAVAALMSFVSYMYGDRIVLKVTRALPASEENEPRLHNLVDGLCRSTALPKPRLHVVADGAVNAFSTGRAPAHSSIAVTRGLLDEMNRVELEAVLAHELSHVNDRDGAVGTIAATLVGAPLLLADAMLARGPAGSSRADGERRGGVGGWVLFVLGLLLSIPALLFAPLIRLAVSKEREYAADAHGATWTRYPPALASALTKAARSPIRHSANAATAHLWLLEPSGPGPMASFLGRLLSTHPPVEERIRILEEM